MDAVAHPGCDTVSSTTTEININSSSSESEEAGGSGDIRPNIPSRVSEDSGLGALNSNLNRKRAPSLHLDMGVVSRASSFAGSINTLATTPTMSRKDGFVFFREESSEK
ncbi:proton channel OtopLc [Trichonephila inaurata madagascariensis]|uniref:Proton channel OtopLc n=1 Tax=Trichonephila inaurata madagascariensis TaxID=2747483 RepID=A0A8X6WZG1_9ARAC|nr:proton channel OtopLc [Trichonephila inaurata madagascariensis]